MEQKKVLKKEDELEVDDELVEQLKQHSGEEQI